MSRRIAIVLVLALTGCSSGSSDVPVNAPSALVGVAVAQISPLSETIDLYGTVEADASAQHALVSASESILARIDAPVGSEVRAGQAIAHLTPSPATRIDFARTAAEAEAALNALARARRLRADGLASQADVEAAQAAARSAQAAGAALADRTAALVLRAPFNGIVQSIAPSPGDLIAAGGNIATVVATDRVRIRFGVAPDLVSRFQTGQRIRVTTGDKETGGEVVAIDPLVDPQSRSASLFVRPDAGFGGAPGDVVRGHAVIAASSRAPTVPYAALLDDGGQPYVFVVSRDVAHRRDVSVGATDGARAAITSGVRGGEHVVVQGNTALDDGMKVRLR